MNIKTSIFLFTAIVMSCTPDKKTTMVQWDVATKLPADSIGQPHLGLAGPVTGILGDTLLIAGGANFPDKMPWDGGAKHYASQVYLYQITASGLQFLQEQELKDAIAYPGSCTTQNAIYFAGGENTAGVQSSVKKLTLTAGRLTEETLPDLPVALTNGSLVFASDKLYYVGGENSEIVSDKIYKLDLSADTAWEEAFTLSYPVTNAVVLSDQKKKIYIAGGRMRNPNSLSTIYNQLLEADLASGTVAKIADLPQAIAAGTGVLDGDGNMLLFGGDDGTTFHQVEALIAKINQTAAIAQKDSLNLEKANMQRAHPGFPMTCWSFDMNKKLWTQLNDISGASPVTTTALLYNDTVIIPSGEIRAGVRTDQILIGKINKN